MGSRGAVIKMGRYVMKTVMIADYGDKSTASSRNESSGFAPSNETSSVVGTLMTLTRRQRGGAGSRARDRGRLLAFLQSEIAETGLYRVVDTE